MPIAKITDVAKYIYNEYEKMSHTTIDEMKLHKLLYLAQRESLAITNEPLFDGDFEGWRYGPVSREIRTEFNQNRLSVPVKLSLEVKYIVDNILSQYGFYETWKLSELTHKETSWLKSRKGLSSDESSANVMELNDIRADAIKVRPYDSVWDMYYDEFEDVEESD